MISVQVLHGDCRSELELLPDNSIDSIVTDPPYELGFMGKSWDASGIAYDQRVWVQCLRVLKPGGHMLAFSGSRTYHRMVCAIEDAGFEIRDQIMWVYGSGFPKSLNISKAIDKAAGAEREVIGQKLHARKGVASAEERTVIGAGAFGEARMGDITAPATDEAKQWDGWGTALKPAHEPIVMARKPLVGTVANNVLTHGTGGINIDGCRVGEGAKKWVTPRGGIWSTDSESTSELVDNPLGRFPANFIHDGSDEVVELFPDKAGAMAPVKSGQKGFGGDIYGKYQQAGDDGATFYNDGLGSAARFFYCAKASKKDRNDGATNKHPTVKPTELMRYLVRLVTPPNGTVLDPFTGSGSTGKAAVLEGFSFIGIEQSEEYVQIAKARIGAHQ